MVSTSQLGRLCSNINIIYTPVILGIGRWTCIWSYLDPETGDCGPSRGQGGYQVEH